MNQSKDSKIEKPIFAEEETPLLRWVMVALVPLAGIIIMAAYRIFKLSKGI